MYFVTYLTKQGKVTFLSKSNSSVKEVIEIICSNKTIIATNVIMGKALTTKIHT